MLKILFFKKCLSFKNYEKIYRTIHSVFYSYEESVRGILNLYTDNINDTAI